MPVFTLTKTRNKQNQCTLNSLCVCRCVCGCVRVGLCAFMWCEAAWEAQSTSKVLSSVTHGNVDRNLGSAPVRMNIERQVGDSGWRAILISVREFRVFQCRPLSVVSQRRLLSVVSQCRLLSVVFCVASEGFLQTTNSGTLCVREYDPYPIYYRTPPGSTWALLLLTWLCLAVSPFVSVSHSHTCHWLWAPFIKKNHSHIDVTLTWIRNCVHAIIKLAWIKHSATGIRLNVNIRGLS